METIAKTLSDLNYFKVEAKRRKQGQRRRRVRKLERKIGMEK